MRRVHRALIAGATGLITAIAIVAVQGVGAQGQEGLRTLSLPGETERVRFNDADGTFQISPDGGRVWSRALPQATQIHLRTRTFDPLRTVQAQAAANAYIVQFAAAPLDSQRRELRRLGVTPGRLPARLRLRGADVGAEPGRGQGPAVTSAGSAPTRPATRSRRRPSRAGCGYRWSTVIWWTRAR